MFQVEKDIKNSTGRREQQQDSGILTSLEQLCALTESNSWPANIFYLDIEIINNKQTTYKASDKQHIQN